MTNSTDYEEVQNYAQKLALQKQDVIIAQNEVTYGLIKRRQCNVNLRTTRTYRWQIYNSHG